MVGTITGLGRVAAGWRWDTMVSYAVTLEMRDLLLQDHPVESRA